MHRVGMQPTRYARFRTLGKPLPQKAFRLLCIVPIAAEITSEKPSHKLRHRQPPSSCRQSTLLVW